MKTHPLSKVADLISMQQGCSMLTFIMQPELLSPSEAWCAAGLDIFQGQVEGLGPVGRWWGDVSNALYC